MQNSTDELLMSMVRDTRTSWVLYHILLWGEQTGKCYLLGASPTIYAIYKSNIWRSIMSCHDMPTVSLKVKVVQIDI
jgi:hypothetical protein